MKSHKTACYIHHESPAALRASAGDDCVFCFMLWLSLFELGDDHFATVDAVGTDSVFLWIWWPEDKIRRAGPEKFAREQINAVCGASCVRTRGTGIPKARREISNRLGDGLVEFAAGMQQHASARPSDIKSLEVVLRQRQGILSDEYTASEILAECLQEASHSVRDQDPSSERSRDKIATKGH